MNKLWITPCFYDSIFLFQIANSVLSRCHDHSLDRYEVAIHPSGRLQYIQLSSGDHQSVYTSILSTHIHPLKTSHHREVFLHLLKSVYSSDNYGFGFGDKVMNKKRECVGRRLHYWGGFESNPRIILLFLLGYRYTVRKFVLDLICTPAPSWKQNCI